MFGIGMQEILLILVIALLVIGPKRLPEVARALGKGYAEFRRTFDEMKTSIEHDLKKDDLGKDLLNIYPPPPAPPPPPTPAPPVAPESLLPVPPAPAAAPEATPEPAHAPSGGTAAGPAGPSGAAG